MKVIEESFIKGKSRKEVITLGKKKFIRIASDKGVDWRRGKTNHQVNKSEFDFLEKEYNKRFPPHFVPSSFMKQIQSEEYDSKKLERGLVEASDGGLNKLRGVKYIKDETGWGLREAKDFVDNFFERRDKYLESIKPIITNDEAKRMLTAFMKEGNKGKLEGVKYVKGITGWGFIDSKNFFEDYERFIEAKKIVSQGF